MTRVSFFFRQGEITGFTAGGHSGYADSGYDIVCAAISALTQTCELGLSEVAGIAVNVKRDDNAGKYEIRLPDKVDEASMLKAQTIFETLLIGLKSIESSYPEFLRVNANERRWN